MRKAHLKIFISEINNLKNTYLADMIPKKMHKDGTFLDDRERKEMTYARKADRCGRVNFYVTGL